MTLIHDNHASASLERQSKTNCGKAVNEGQQLDVLVYNKANAAVQT